MQDLGRYTKRNHLQIQTRYVSVLVVASVVIVGLVFMLGILVGSRQVKQQTCPQPDPLALLDLESNEPIPPAAPKAVNLSFHKTLATKQDPVPTPASLKEEAGDSSPSGDAQLAKTNVASDSVPLAVPRLEEPPIPEKVAREEPGTYSLQVGSFQDRREASKMIRKLERAGHQSFLVSVKMPDRGGLWFRVRVGPFHSKREAWKYKKIFEDRERLPAFVVKRRARG